MAKPLSKLVRPLSKGQVTLPMEFLPLRPTAGATALREYSHDDIDRFVREDRLDPAIAAKVRVTGRPRPPLIAGWYNRRMPTPSSGKSDVVSSPPPSPKSLTLSVVFVVVGLLYCLAAAGTAWAGVIKGAVRLAGTVEPKKLPVTIDQYVCGKEKDTEDLVVGPDKGVRNALVYLQTPPTGTKLPADPPSVPMDQKGCMFAPRVVVVPAGGTVDFLNSDRLLHNLHSRGKENPPFNRTQPKGRTIPIVFRKPEILRVECDLHSWMRGWIVVADHPFYTLTNEGGEFVLKDVPPGNYTLTVWQESLGTVSKEVTVGETGAATANFQLQKK